MDELNILGNEMVSHPLVIVSYLSYGNVIFPLIAMIGKRLIDVAHNL